MMLSTVDTATWLDSISLTRTSGSNSVQEDLEIRPSRGPDVNSHASSPSSSVRDI